jgi:muramoyltetrapeptide carboxypeptidase
MVKTMALLKPPAVPSGAPMSVIAPASFAQPDRVKNGLDAVRELGFEPALGRHSLERGPLYFGGTSQQREEDLHAAFANPDTRAVMALRGGYGSNYLLEHLNLQTIAAHPKPFFAYSDLTAVQLRLLDQIGLPAFHGPMLAADFYRRDGVHLPSFRAALAGDPYSVDASEGLRLLKPPPPGSDRVKGTLYGGCLSILVSLLGTAWEPATEGKLLFLEDTGAKPYQIDRMLWQLRQAGKFEDVPGIIFGEMLHCASPGTGPELLENTILSALEGFPGPVAIGLRSGHVSRQNVTLVFGIEAELHAANAPQLSLLESGVTR